MPSLDRKYRSVALGASMLVLGLLADRPVLAQFCVADPLIPPCCPSPCPVFDPSRIPKLLGDVTSLEQIVGADSQIVQSITQLGQTIGNTAVTVTSVTKQLSAFPSTVSGEVTAIQSGLPTNPVAALAVLKQTMFEPGAQASAAQLAARRASRTAAAQQEQVGALTTGLMRSSSLPSVISLQSQLAGTASGSDQLHTDFAANSTARLALYQDMGGLHQLAAAWLSQRAAGSALKHPNIAGGTLPQPAATNSGTNIQTASPVQTLQAAADQLVLLHDSRVSAQALLTAYPSLQQTIASSGLATQFLNAAASSLQKSLSVLGAPTEGTLSGVEKALLTVDTSGWLDSGKDVQSRQAAVQVLAILVANGTVSPALIADKSAAGEQVEQAMAAWLDANKQNQYWAQLAQSAQKSMAALDGRLGALSDRVGLDVTGTSAAAAETALLTKLIQDPSASQWQGLITAASQDPGAQDTLKVMVAR